METQKFVMVKAPVSCTSVVQILLWHYGVVPRTATGGNKVADAGKNWAETKSSVSV